MITVKLWKDITGYNPINVETGEFDVNGTMDVIMQVKGKSKEELEAMDISDLLPEYLDCVKMVNEAVFAKIGQLPKKKEVNQ